MRRFSVALSLALHFLAFVAPPLAVHAEDNPFSDIDSGSVHFTALTYLKQRNVIEGYPDGTFQPKNKVNRAEAAKKYLSLNEAERRAERERQETQRKERQAIRKQKGLALDPLADETDDGLTANERHLVAKRAGCRRGIRVPDVEPDRAVVS